MFHAPNGRGQVFLNSSCSGQIDWTYHKSVANIDTSVSVTYVPYNINETVFATNTPYTTQRGVDNGVEFYYNPLMAQVGIFLYLFLAVIFVLGLIAIFRKW